MPVALLLASAADCAARRRVPRAGFPQGRASQGRCRRSHPAHRPRPPGHRRWRNCSGDPSTERDGVAGEEVGTARSRPSPSSAAASGPTPFPRWRRLWCARAERRGCRPWAGVRPHRWSRPRGVAGVRPPVRMTMRTRGWASSTARAAVRPSTRGICRSIRTTSGRVRTAAATSLPSAHWPTTPMSCSPRPQTPLIDGVLNDPTRRPASPT